MNVYDMLKKYEVSEEVLQNTPRRFEKAISEMLSGYQDNPQDILQTQFEQDTEALYSGVILLRSISFHSVCEHHLLPFSGYADIAYVPSGDKIVGLSKLARLVDAYAKRLQVQERLTQSIVLALETYLQPQGAFCRIRAEHACMRLRGVSKQSSEMVTLSATGVLREKTDHQTHLHLLLQS